MRIGLLGSGEMGKRHLAAAAGLDGVEIVTRDLPPYHALDHAAFLHALLADPALDAVDICLPTPLHAPTAIAVLAAGKHVLCEKPLALSTADCARVLAAASDGSRTFMVAHVLRFFPAYRHLLGLVRGGAFGPVQRAVFARMSGLPGWAAWLANPIESGGAILDLLVHDFDQVLTLFGPPARIQAAHIESANTVRAVLTCNGVPIVVEGGWFRDARPFGMSFDVQFAHARLVYRDEQLTLHRGGAPDEAITLAARDPYREQLRYFIHCCTTHHAPADCPPEAAAEAVALALAVREAAAQTQIS